MAAAHTGALPVEDPIAQARREGVIRFAVGTTAAFVLSEAMGWYPSFLAPVLAAVLLSSLPAALPIRAGLALILIQAAAAFASYALTSLLQETPLVLFGAIGLILLLSFSALAQGRSFLPILLLLISIATIPIVTITSPQQAIAFPQAYARGMMVAVGVVWTVDALWPKRPPAASPAAKAPIASPFAMALAGTAIVLPMMLVFLMFGLTDALPVLITTVVLVVNFDPKRGAAQGTAMIIGNFIGGMIALSSYALIQIAPSLAALLLVTFIVSLLFGVRIMEGGLGGTVGLITYNQAMIMLSLALLPGPSSPGLWATRLFQFGIACAFAIAMMSLVLPRTKIAEVDAVTDQPGSE